MVPDPLSPALLAILALIVVKEAGVPIPVPGDLIVIGAGVAAGQGDLQPVPAILAIVLVSVVGGVVQYGLLRSVARPALLRLLGRLGGADRLDRQTARLRDGGARTVALARSTPGVRIVTIAASAIAGVPAAAFVTGLTVGNAIFIGAHFALGYVVGEPVVRIVGGALGPIAVGAVLLAVVGAVGWTVLARRRRVGSAFDPQPLPVVGAWADACCPACLALGAIESGRGLARAGGEA